MGISWGIFGDFRALQGATSRLALVAAAGVIAGGIGAAQAADLGGDCCADLEERVAELEATTARKGNRKVSLQVYGQVNEMVMFWDDGAMSDAYVVTNNVSRNRFGFRGSAKIDSDWSAGFRIEHGIRTASSETVRQFNTGFDPGDDRGGGTDVRHVYWYLQSKSLGTITVGQTDTPMSNAFTTTLANISHTDPGFDDWGGSFNIRGVSGTLYTGDAWADLVNPVSGTLSLSRRNLVKYDSPTFGGLQFQAAWGEADFWAVSLAYAGEFGGFRVAAKIGYTDMTDPQLGCEVATPGSSTAHNETDCQMWATSASIMHVATGLFVSGSYGELTDNGRGAGFDSTDTSWYVQGGIEQKFNALGKTTIYGEYGVHQNGTLIAGYGGDTISSWGFGLVQSIDAAAMDLYIAYRNHTVEIPAALTAEAAEDLQLIGVGAIIKF